MSEVTQRVAGPGSDPKTPRIPEAKKATPGWPLGWGWQYPE